MKVYVVTSGKDIARVFSTRALADAWLAFEKLDHLVYEVPYDDVSSPPFSGLAGYVDLTSGRTDLYSKAFNEKTFDKRLRVAKSYASGSQELNMHFNYYDLDRARAALAGMRERLVERGAVDDGFYDCDTLEKLTP